MPPTVKGPPYDNTGRSAASHARRATVLAAARTLFLDRGYVRTYFPALALLASGSAGEAAQSGPAGVRFVQAA